MVKAKSLFLLLLFLIISYVSFSQNDPIKVIAYYAGGSGRVPNYPVENLTHIIYSFSHLKGNQLHIGNADAIATVNKLVSLKKRNSSLKVLLSLGGWGGCETCSAVFSSEEDRAAFAESVRSLLVKYNADGIDLDWEYPAIEGFIGHAYKPADKENFTELVKALREKLGNRYEISFAAGGFQSYMDSSIAWNEVMPLVNYVNLMSYDLVNGYSAITGHHTPLYSTPQQMLSVDWGVNALIDRGVPKEKIVIGAAFYGRIWENVPAIDSGLYQPGKFKKSESIKSIDALLSKGDQYKAYWDDVAKAPFIYNAKEKLFITYDNKRSVGLKTSYAIEKGLGGIMFWQLGHDYYKNGLLDAIVAEKGK